MYVQFLVSSMFEPVVVWEARLVWPEELTTTTTIWRIPRIRKLKESEPMSAILPESKFIAADAGRGPEKEREIMKRFVKLQYPGLVAVCIIESLTQLRDAKHHARWLGRAQFAETNLGW